MVMSQAVPVPNAERQDADAEEQQAGVGERARQHGAHQVRPHALADVEREHDDGGERQRHDAGDRDGEQRRAPGVARPAQPSRPGARGAGRVPALVREVGHVRLERAKTAMRQGPTSENLQACVKIRHPRRRDDEASYTGTMRSLPNEMVTRVPWPRRALHGELGAVGGSERARERQAEPQARALCLGRLAHAWAGAHARSSVGDRDGERAVAGVDDAHGHAVARARKFYGIGEEVEQHLPQRELVGDDARQVRGHVGRKLEAGALGKRTRHRQAALDHGRRIEVGEGERRQRRAGSVTLQHAVDDAQRMAGAAVDVAGIALVARVGDRAEMLRLQDLGVGDDGAERRAQLVREPGIERHVEVHAVSAPRQAGDGGLRPMRPEPSLRACRRPAAPHAMP